MFVNMVMLNCFQNLEYLPRENSPNTKATVSLISQEETHHTTGCGLSGESPLIRVTFHGPSCISTDTTLTVNNILQAFFPPA